MTADKMETIRAALAKEGMSELADFVVDALKDDLSIDDILKEFEKASGILVKL